MAKGGGKRKVGGEGGGSSGGGATSSKKSKGAEAMVEIPLMGSWDSLADTREKRFWKLVKNGGSNKKSMLEHLALFTSDEINSYDEEGRTALHYLLNKKLDTVTEEVMADITYASDSDTVALIALCESGANPNKPLKRAMREKSSSGKSRDKHTEGSTCVHMFVRLLAFECVAQAIGCIREMEPAPTDGAVFARVGEEIFAALMDAGMDLKRVDSAGTDATVLARQEGRAWKKPGWGPMDKVVPSAWRAVQKNHKDKKAKK